MYKSVERYLKLAEMSSGRILTSSLGTLAKHLSRLVTTNTSTPLTTLLLVLVGAENLIRQNKE